MTTATSAGDEFGALLDTLGAVTTESSTMVKALAADSEFEMDDEGKQKLDAEGKPVRKTAAAAGGGEGELMGKAFSATLSDGSTVEGFDATDMLKALDGDMTVLRKALPGLVSVIRVQGNMLKALTGEVAALRGGGTGRRAMVSVHDRPVIETQRAPEGTMAKAEGQLTPGEFMAKALDAKGAGKISSLDLTRLEACMNSGKQPPAELAAAVMTHVR